MDYEIGDEVTSTIGYSLVGRITKINNDNITVLCGNREILFHKDYIRKLA